MAVSPTCQRARGLWVPVAEESSRASGGLRQTLRLKLSVGSSEGEKQGQKWGSGGGWGMGALGWEVRPGQGRQQVLGRHAQPALAGATGGGGGQNLWPLFAKAPVPHLQAAGG